jgi:hypothetical protein
MPLELFNRDSQDIPENRRMPILAGMSGEERVSNRRLALLVRATDNQRGICHNQIIRRTAGNETFALRGRR